MITTQTLHLRPEEILKWYNIFQQKKISCILAFVFLYLFFFFFFAALVVSPCLIEALKKMYTQILMQTFVLINLTFFDK